MGDTQGSPRQRALDFLIAARWLTGEAREQRRPVAAAAVARRLGERIDALPNGKPELEEELSSTGQTIDDLKVEIEAELAAATLRGVMAREVRPVTTSEVARYYKRQRARFRVPELRVVDLIEDIPTRQAAITLGARLGSGARFAGRSLHERVAREPPAEAARRENGELVRGIFTAPLGKVAAPARFHKRWVLIVLRKVIPSRVMPLAAVRQQISARLSRQRRRLTEAGFIQAFTSKWTARTTCRPGYVVERCAEYRGRPRTRSNPLTAG